MDDVERIQAVDTNQSHYELSSLIDRDYMLRNAITNLGRKLFNFTPTSCGNCYVDALIRIKLLIRKDMKTIDKKYTLSATGLLTVRGEIYTNANLTDDISIKLLEEFPLLLRFYNGIPHDETAGRILVAFAKAGLDSPLHESGVLEVLNRLASPTDVGEVLKIAKGQISGDNVSIGKVVKNNQAKKVKQVKSTDIESTHQQVDVAEESKSSYDDVIY